MMNVRNFKDELGVIGDSVVVTSPREKTCSKCGDTLPYETGFYDDERSRDGKRHQCIPCRDADSMNYAKLRAARPMCARAEAMKELFTKRFRVIKKAGFSIDKEGLVIQNKIDRLLKKHGLQGAVRIKHVSHIKKSKEC